MDKKRIRNVAPSKEYLRRPPSIGIAVLLTSLISGCTGAAWLAPADDGAQQPMSYEEINATLSQPEFAEIVHEEARVVSSTGAMIWVDWYRPAESTEQVPVILTMTPYRNLAETSAQCGEADRTQCLYDAELVSFFAHRGYAVAFADVAGTHASGGCLDLLGTESRQEAYDVVEWLGTQSWTNGRVGMYGGSYDGSMAIGAAVLDPPHLATIVPFAAITNHYDYFFYDGVPYYLAGPAVMMQYLVTAAAPGSTTQTAASPDRVTCWPENLAAGSDQSGDWSEYWVDRDLRPLASAIRASVLQAHGYQDPTAKPSQTDDFWNNVTSEKRLILGQWGHEPPARKDWTLIRHRWFDHYLKEIDTGLLEDLPPVLTEDTSGAWQGLDALPNSPANATFYLTSEGSLLRTSDDSGSLAIRDYPRGSFRDPAASTLTAAGRLALETAGELIFRSEPLQTDLRFLGRPVLHLSATTDASSTHWVVHILDADAESGGSPLNSGFLDTRHRQGVDRPHDLTAGEEYSATVRLFPHNDVIPAGHSIVIVLTNNDFRVQQDTTFAGSQIRLGGVEPSRLVLPLAPVGRQMPAEALRPELG